MQFVSSLKLPVRRLKKNIHALKSKYPFRVQCNVCGWNGRVLSGDFWHPYTICHRCGSQVRHRLILAAFAFVPVLGLRAILEGKRILHIAPEPSIGSTLRQHAGNYVSADLCRRDVDLQLDMCNMKALAASSFDLVVACDVLEHVPDDSMALREVHRVLADQGWAILTVPQSDHLHTKYEDPAMVAPEQRKMAFGQEDHLRIYGKDFKCFLESHGFTVLVVDENSFEPEVVQRHVLFPPILSKNPLATNHRKIYFAQKKSS